MHWNINTIKSHKFEKLKSIEQISPLLCSVQESRIEFDPPRNYEAYYAVPRQTNDGGAKINCCILVKNDASAQVISKEVDSICLKIKLSG